MVKKCGGKTVLVTGGAGYVGSVLTRSLLECGYSVRVIDSLRHGSDSLSVTSGSRNFYFFKGDITVKEDVEKAITGVDSLVHLAAIVGEPACSREPELAGRVNLDGTKLLVDAARKMGVSEFIFASTCSNYGVSSPDSYANENFNLNPVSLYAETKIGAEKYILENTSESFSTTILRLATVYGASPRMRFDLLVNDFTKEAFARKKIVIYGGQFWRPYIHVKDVAKAVITVLNTDTGSKRGEVFNAGITSENYQKLSIANMVREEIKETAIEVVNKGNDPRDYRVSFEKIKNKIGFVPGMSVKDGIREIISLLERNIIIDYDNPKYTN